MDEMNGFGLYKSCGNRGECLDMCLYLGVVVCHDQVCRRGS